MTRDELIEVAAKAIAAQGFWDDLETAEIAIDAVESLIRADERAAIMSRVKQDMTVDREKWAVLARSTSMADLRASVEALRWADLTKAHVAWNEALDAVLALLDGGSDD